MPGILLVICLVLHSAAADHVAPGLMMSSLPLQTLTVPFYIWEGLRTVEQQQSYLLQLLPQRDASSREQEPAYDPPRLSEPAITTSSESGRLCTTSSPLCT